MFFQQNYFGLIVFNVGILSIVCGLKVNLDLNYNYNRSSFHDCYIYLAVTNKCQTADTN